MEWWEIAIIVYFMLTPWSQIATIATIAVLIEDFKDRKKPRGGRS